MANNSCRISIVYWRFYIFQYNVLFLTYNIHTDYESWYFNVCFKRKLLRLVKFPLNWLCFENEWKQQRNELFKDGLKSFVCLANDKHIGRPMKIDNLQILNIIEYNLCYVTLDVAEIMKIPKSNVENNLHHLIFFYLDEIENRFRSRLLWEMRSRLFTIMSTKKISD